MIIDNINKLKDHYEELGENDIFLGLVNHRNLKLCLLIDLLERGIKCHPSALSQVLSTSKAAQAFIFNKWMIPNTIVINRRHDLIEAINEYNKKNIQTVVTKEEHMHCGHGVRKWPDIETLYNQRAFNESSSYPFVLQPFLKQFTDIRVIIVGDYVEGYCRDNPFNFRKNLSLGGNTKPFKLDSKQKEFCREIMLRGKFPYAHIDLHITKTKEIYLSEIALNGGAKGARISRKDLENMKNHVLIKLAKKSE